MTRPKIPLICGVVLGVCGAFITAAEKRKPAHYGFVQRLTLTDGLSQASVNCLCQDSVGFLWAGTQDGLNRYDGYRFQVFRRIPGNPASLSDNWVTALAETPRGVLWVGTRNGLCRFDLRTGRWTRAPLPRTGFQESANVDVQTVLADGPSLWVGTREGGIFRVDVSSNAVSRLEGLFPDRTPFRVQAIKKDAKGYYWVGTSSGLLRLDAQARVVQRLGRGSPLFASAESLNVQAVLPVGEKTLWIATRGGLGKLDTVTSSITWFQRAAGDPESLSDNNVTTLHLTRDGALWAGTKDGGLNRQEAGQRTFTRFMNNPDNPYSLGANEVLCLLEDAGGILWAGCWAGGISKLVIAPFAFYDYQKDSREGLSGRNIRTILESRAGLIWVGTSETGLNCLDPTTGLFTHYRNKPGDAKSLATDHRIWALTEGSDGSIYVGFGGNGLDRLDPVTGVITHFRYDSASEDSLPSDVVRCLRTDERGRVWVGTENGLSRFEPETGKFLRFFMAPPGEPEVDRSRVDNIYFDRRGWVWCSLFNAGLCVFDPAGGGRWRVRHDESDAAGLSGNNVTAVYQDRAGNVWLGTWGGGLQVLEAGSRLAGKPKLHSIGEAEGFHATSISGILEDLDGRLWVSTSIGIFLRNPKTGKFQFFDSRDGLPDCNFNPRACWLSKTGNILLGGLSGLTVLNPSAIRKNDHVPPIVLTGFFKYNQPFELPAPVNEAKEVVLSSEDTLFSFTFTALDFSAPNKNLYAYKLEGFNKEWIQTTAENRQATFTNLDPGDYVLRIKGSNDQGLWNESGVSLKLVILPPWYRTGYAYLGMTLTLIALIGWFVRSRTHRHRQELAIHKAELEYQRLKTEWFAKIDKLKDDFLANTSHELRTPLTSVIGYANLIRKRLNEVVFNPAVEEGPRKKKAIDQVQQGLDILLTESQRLMVLIEDLLDLNALENQALAWDVQEIDLRAVALDVLAELKAAAAGKGLALTLEAPSAVPPVLGDRLRLRQVLWNLVSNAIKFSPSGVIQVQATLRTVPASDRDASDKVEILIRVVDNGLGLSDTDCQTVFERFRQIGDTLTNKPKGAGLGLSICKRIIEHHHGKIWAECNPEGGAIFLFALPVRSSECGNSTPP